MVIYRNVVPSNVTITTMGIILNSGYNSNLFRIMELLKKINYTYCNSVVREVYDNLYAGEKKVDGSGV